MWPNRNGMNMNDFAFVVSVYAVFALHTYFELGEKLKKKNTQISIRINIKLFVLGESVCSGALCSFRSI